MIEVFLIAIFATLGLIATCVVGYLSWKALGFIARIGKAVLGMNVTPKSRKRRRR